MTVEVSEEAYWDLHNFVISDGRLDMGQSSISEKGREELRRWFRCDSNWPTIQT